MIYMVCNENLFCCCYILLIYATLTNNLMHQYKLGVEQSVWKVMQRRDLGFLVNTNLSINQQWALAAKDANNLQGCIRQSVASSSKSSSCFVQPCGDKSGVLGQGLDWAGLDSQQKKRDGFGRGSSVKGHEWIAQKEVTENILYILHYTL